MDFFLLPERKKMCKKIDIVSGFRGVFPWKESMWKSQCAFVCIASINDTVFTFERVHTSPPSVKLSIVGRVYAWKRFKNGALMSIDLCTKHLRMLTKMTATYTTVHNELYLRKRQCVCAELKLKWKIFFSGIDKNVNKETSTTLNIIVSSLASKCFNQQLIFDRNKSFCHCQVSSLKWAPEQFYHLLPKASWLGLEWNLAG